MYSQLLWKGYVVFIPFPTVQTQAFHDINEHYRQVDIQMITLGNKFLVINCFWGKISYFLLISRRWARIWQRKLEIGFGFWGIRKSLLYI